MGSKNSPRGLRDYDRHDMDGGLPPWLAGCWWQALIFICMSTACFLLIWWQTHRHGNSFRPQHHHQNDHFNGARMDCGFGVSLCGVLALETGLGHGVYAHRQPVVHGLWPETGNYGTSKCVRPTKVDAPKHLYSCYKAEGENAHQMGFQTHEWNKHGVCAGGSGADAFFEQVCSLAAQPLEVLRRERARGANVKAMADALQSAGYQVWNVNDHHGEVSVTTCGTSTGRWILAKVNDFARVCGDGSAPAATASSPAPVIAANPPAPVNKLVQSVYGDSRSVNIANHYDAGATSCVPGKHGPQCSSDNNCAGVSGCVRCAHSGFCTDQRR